MERDPIAEAIMTTAQAVGTALQEMLARGLELTPTSNGGFLARIAPVDGSTRSSSVDTSLGEARSW